MPPKKLVSVIIPTFNRAHFLPTAIESVLNQTYPNIQVIVIDDGSTDDTRQIVAEFENVEYYYQENKRQGAARNLGLSKTRGDYIASLDSDDAWHESFIEESVNCLEEHNLDFVFLNWIYQIDSVDFRSDWYRSRIWKHYIKNPFEQWFLLNSTEVRRLFIETCPAPSSGLLIKKDSITTKWNEEMLIADDWCLILDIVLNRECRAAFTMKPFWVKGIHDQNIYDGQEKIATIKKLGLHDENLLAKRFESQLTPAEKKVFRKRMAGHHFNIGFWDLRKRGLSKKAIKSLAASFSISPTGIFSLIVNRLRNRFLNMFSDNHRNLPSKKTDAEEPSLNF